MLQINCVANNKNLAPQTLKPYQAFEIYAPKGNGRKRVENPSKKHLHLLKE